MILKERDRTRQRLRRRAGGKTRVSDDAVWPAADRAHPLGAAGFDTAIHPIVLRCPCHHPNSSLAAGKRSRLWNGGYRLLALLSVRSLAQIEPICQASKCRSCALPRSASSATPRLSARVG